MKNYICIVTLTAVALCLFTCSDNGTAPDSGELLDSQSIGPSGGTVSHDNLIVSIPSGSLDSTASVKLYAVNDATPLDADCVTGKFRIEGISRGDSLDIYLKTNDTVGDSGWIVMGLYDYHPEGDSVGISYFLLPAEDSSGYLHAAIASGNSVSKIGKSTGYTPEPHDLAMVLFGIYDIYKTASTASYNINYPVQYGNQLSDLESLLDQVYYVVEYKGFSLDALKSKVRVDLIAGNEVSAFPHCFNIDGKATINISLRFSGINGLSDPEIKTAFAGAMFRAIPYLYMDRDKLEYFLWVQLAMKEWAEASFSGQSDYCGDDYEENAILPFVGMEPQFYDEEMEQKNYGSSMVSLLKYLAYYYRKDLLDAAFDYMKDYNRHFVAAVDMAVPDDFCDWWPGYIKEIITENHCPVAAEKIVEAKTASFTFDSEDDLGTTFSYIYKDMAAKVFFIGLSYDSFGEGDVLRFGLSGSGDIEIDEMHIILFKYKNNTLTYIGDAYNNLTVSDIKTMHDNGEDLVAVVVDAQYNNSYFYPVEVTLDLEVELVKASGASYDFVKIFCSVNPEYEDYDGPTYPGASNLERYWAFIGSTSGGVFTGTPDPTWHGYDATGSMSVTFDPVTLNISSLSVNVTEYSTNSRTEASLDAVSIPFKESLSWEVCEVKGSSTCSHITSLGWTNIWDVDQYRWTTLKSYSCENDGHYIKVELWDTQ